MTLFDYYLQYMTQNLRGLPNRPGGHHTYANR